MSLPNENQLQCIHQICEALSGGERRNVFYLCESSNTDNSVASVKELLQSKVFNCRDGHLFLAELMLHLRRYDILRKVFRTSRDEVETTLRSRQLLPRFRVLMTNISEDMAGEDLDSAKFLLSCMLTHDKIEKAKNFLDLIIELEKLDKVSPERVDFVEECLRNISRNDLAKKVNLYKMSVVTSEQHSSTIQQQRFSAPSPSTTPNSSHSRQQRRSFPFENSAAFAYRENDFQSPLEWYKFNTDPRGVCVIIDCVGNDGEMLEHTFKALHFKVVLHKWLSLDETLSTLRDMSRKSQNHEGDGFVCCIISRGTDSHLLATDSYSEGLRLDKVRRLFTADACPVLAGKPKLFFIQRYRVPVVQFHARMNHQDENLETDGCDWMPRGDFIPTDADVLWSHCWTDEGQLQQGHHRSVYLKALTDALHKGQKRKTPLVDIHVEVNGTVYKHNSRSPAEEYHINLKHTLRKELYF